MLSGSTEHGGWDWRNGAAAVLFVALLIVVAFAPLIALSVIVGATGRQPPTEALLIEPAWIFGWLMYLGRD